MCRLLESKCAAAFNPAEVLAEKLAEELGLPKRTLLLKLYETRTQHFLKSSERAGNVLGAFAAVENADLEGKHSCLWTISKPPAPRFRSVQKCSNSRAQKRCFAVRLRQRVCKKRTLDKWAFYCYPFKKKLNLKTLGKRGKSCPPFQRTAGRCKAEESSVGVALEWFCRTFVRQKRLAPLRV